MCVASLGPQEPRQRDTISRMPKPTSKSLAPTHAENPDAAVALHGSPTQRFRRGIALGLPIFLGYVPVGMAFGILATTVGFTVFEATLCSATALAGAGQFIALSLISTGAASALLATAVVNLRYVLFGTTLSPGLRGFSLPTQAWLAFTLTDETFAVNVADRRQGLSTAASMAGVGAIAWLGWVLGTLVGAAGAAWIGDPSRWGVDFAMPAMFAALFVALAEDSRHVWVGFGAGLIALTLPVLAKVGVVIPQSWIVVVASMAAATIASGVLRER